MQLQHAPFTRVWLVSLGRDRTRTASKAEDVRQMLAAGYTLTRTDHFIPIDPVYLRLKNLILGRASYPYRLTIEQYTQVSP